MDLLGLLCVAAIIGSGQESMWIGIVLFLGGANIRPSRSRSALASPLDDIHAPGHRSKGNSRKSNFALLARINFVYEFMMELSAVDRNLKTRNKWH